MGIGDVSLPLCEAVIEALHNAINDQAHAGTFHGYMPECGAAFFREAVAAHYAGRGVTLLPDDVFVSTGHATSWAIFSICSAAGKPR